MADIDPAVIQNELDRARGVCAIALILATTIRRVLTTEQQDEVKALLKLMATHEEVIANFAEITATNPERIRRFIRGLAETTEPGRIPELLN